MNSLRPGRNRTLPPARRDLAGPRLMCAPLTARGAQGVGIDAAANPVAAARLHAHAGGLVLASTLNLTLRSRLPAVHRDGWTREIPLNPIASFGRPSP